MDGAQNSPERYDLIVRAFPEQPFAPEIRTLWMGTLQLLGKRAKSNSNTGRTSKDDNQE